MSNKSGNKKKDKQLGMSHGTAANKLRKLILFALVVQTGLDNCFQCGEKIEIVGDLSIEHKIPWLDSGDPVGLYFDLSNISFSHISCNIGGRRSPTSRVEHGTNSKYQYGCRCESCRRAHGDVGRRDREKEKILKVGRVR